jgi:peptide/nickel transport system permease protein
MATEPDIPSRAPSLLTRALESDLWFSFTRSPVVVVAGSITLLYFLAALLAPLISPHNPFDPGSLIYSDAFTPPAWVEGGKTTYLMGTDDQGRDILSTLIYGARISLLVGFAAVMLSAVIGITLGILAGYLGGVVETLTMRAADVQLTVPGILVALMIDGVVRIKLREWSAEGGLSAGTHETVSLFVLIFAIGLSDWPQYARVVRGATMVEKGKEYVQAAKVIGVSPLLIMIRHILPNVLGPVLVLATIGLALAIIAEATLSFLGVGMPPTTPSLGTLIRIGNNFLFSGEWWITFFPCIALILLVLSVNLLGDWLRDALNPKLR